MLCNTYQLPLLNLVQPSNQSSKDNDQHKKIAQLNFSFDPSASSAKLHRKVPNTE